ncbi:MAG: ABC transporter permease [Frankiales bacterium]|nr:ABC transporter permease [Frankiales bacterium]
MTAALTLLRGLAHRAGTTAVILLVALCATAAAAVGPTYYEAAKDSILQDTISSVSVVDRGLEAVAQGPAQNSIGTLRANVDDQMQRVVGSRSRTDRMFDADVLAVETTRFFTATGENVGLVWRTGVCGHLRLRAGHCPQSVGDIIIATSLAALNGWHVGDVLSPAGGTQLRVTGVYVPPPATDDYWFARGSVYFPNEIVASIANRENANPYDAMFTPQSTIDALHGNPQGTTVVSRVLHPQRVQPTDVDVLSRVAAHMTTSPVFAGQVTIITGLGNMTDTVHASWSALAIPVVVVTAELLVLTWLLLFLVVTDAVEARGTEIALAKLRGYGAARSVVFGLGETVTLLVVALPVGAVAGWLLTEALGKLLLRSGTPIGLPALGWAAAAVAAVGGAAAVIAAARRTLRRPVVEQWRRTGRRATDRGWVFDAVVLTGAVAGLVQLAVTGTFGSARRSALALLVPGLLGLAVAVVGSRLLPLACRAAYARTRRTGPLGPFLAIRHIARRPGGTRTTMILATAVALATFSMAAWSVGASNRSRVAQVTIGAPTVLTVAPPLGVDLGAAVSRIDPSGKHAAAVDTYDSGQGVLLAVQPSRFAAVANWKAAAVGDPGHLLSQLHPAAPAPIVVNGGEFRAHILVGRFNPAGVKLSLDVVALGSSAPTPIGLGVAAGAGPVVRTGSLAGCPCVLRDLQVESAAPGSTQLAGQLTLTGLEIRSGGGAWRPLPGVLDASRWVDSVDQQVAVRPSGGGIRWSFFAPVGTLPTLRVLDRPEPLPAVASTAFAGGVASMTAPGLDAGNLRVNVLRTARTIPSAPADAVVVDLDYAVRAAYNNLLPATQQVWVRGSDTAIQHGLKAAHIAVISRTTSQSLDDRFSRQGPGLASVLFLADAAAAAALSALAAVLSLAASARRRRYEYASLGATGASRRTLYSALAIEQTVVVGFGALLGVAAGLGSVWLAGANVPNFVVAPARDLLRHRPSVVLLIGVLGGALVLLLAAAMLAAAGLLRSVSPEQLRESQV